MRKPNWRDAVAVVAALGLMVSACTSSDDTSGDTGDTTTTAGGGAPSGELGTGVTDDSIKIAYTFVDTDALQAMGLKTFHGPYADIMQSLIDDLNENGGINGRTVELINIPYNPSGGNEAQLTACAQATEDEQVFAVLGGLQSESNLCIVEQGSTTLVGGGQTPQLLERARAPWATWTAQQDVATQAMVDALDAEGKLEGHTIAVYGLAGNQENIDQATAALEDAGADVAFTAINDADTADRSAIDAQDEVLGQRMKDEGIDAVFIAGTNVPGPLWAQNDFTPALWVTDAGILSFFVGLGAYDAFPEVLAMGGAPAQEAWDSETAQSCLSIYEEASGESPPSPEDATADEQSPVTALLDACNAFLVFTTAAEAAGDTLNQDTFLEGVVSTTEIDLPGGPGTFGPDKLAAQTVFRLFEPNPDFVPDSGDDPLIPASDETYVVD